MFPHIRKVATQVDWRAAAEGPIPADRLLRALLHSAEGVVFTAAELLEHGSAGSAAGSVVTEALATGSRYTYFIITQGAPSVLPLNDAAAAVRAGLRRDDRPPLRCVRYKENVAQHSCPKCHLGLESPRGALLEQLIRCNTIPASQLAVFTHDKDHDVARIAKKKIASKGGAP